MKESIDIFSAEGFPLGSKDKDKVHADGDWHKAFHLWTFFKQGDRVYQIFQLRSKSKKVYPGLVDCSAAGHYRENELLPDGVREAEEELGTSIEYSSLKFLGVRKKESHDVNKPNNELQYVFLLNREIDLNDIKFDTTEVEAVLKVDNEHLGELLLGKRESITCSGIAIQAEKIIVTDFKIGKKDFIPSIDSYYEKICFAISQINSQETFPLFLNIPNLLDGIELNDSNILSAYIESKSTKELNTEFEKIFSDKICKKRFFKALILYRGTSDSFVEFLLTSIEYSDGQIVNKLYTLGWIKSSKSIQALKTLSQYKNSKIRATAIFVFGEVCGKNDFEFIGNKVNDDDDRVSKAACFSLGWNQGKERFLILTQQLELVRKEKRAFVEKAIKMFDV